MKLLSSVLLWVPSVLGAALSIATFNQPVLWEDLADLDIFRVDNKYYYSASTMHYSPGAPILESYDLVNWEYIGHSVPSLDWGPEYSLANGSNAYIKGVWASSLRYRPSNGMWYWIGCIEFNKTYIYTASSPQGPWTKSGMINTCYYDCGLLIDDDDIMYAVYGRKNIHVAQLSADGRSEVRSEKVFSGTFYIEGSRFYKVNGTYYIFNTEPPNAEWVLQGSSPFGPFTQKLLLEDMPTPVPGAGIPHQGGIVDTPNGDWYYMAFVDDFPGGRTPVLAPIVWGSDGFPSVVSVNGSWGTSYPYPTKPHPLSSPTGTDNFNGNKLGPKWEWNHNPDPKGFTVQNGLTLRTVTITDDLYKAQNTLTHRIIGPSSTATIQLDISKMLSGDRTGLVLLRDRSAYVAIVNKNGTSRVSMVDGLVLRDNGSSWVTNSIGNEAAGVDLPENTSTVWLRAFADISPAGDRAANFSYSINGRDFISIGIEYTLNNDWKFYMGYRYGIFNFATSSLGGSVNVNSFTMVNGMAV